MLSDPHPFLDHLVSAVDTFAMSQRDATAITDALTRARDLDYLPATPQNLVTVLRYITTAYAKHIDALSVEAIAQRSTRAVRFETTSDDRVRLAAFLDACEHDEQNPHLTPDNCLAQACELGENGLPVSAFLVVAHEAQRVIFTLTKRGLDAADDDLFELVAATQDTEMPLRDVVRAAIAGLRSVQC